MTDDRQSFGRWGETLAANYLSKKGYLILDRNVRTPYGEIDLVTVDGKVTVFVEVKTRRSSKYGFPEDAIDPLKIEHIINSARAYLQSHPEVRGDWRIDVIAIIGKVNDPPEEIEHFENAIK
jgi:putative endonuclease